MKSFLRLSQFNKFIFLEKLTILLSKGKLDFSIVFLKNMDLELGVDIGKVDEGEGVGAGLPQDPLEDAVNDDNYMISAKSLL